MTNILGSKLHYNTMSIGSSWNQHHSNIHGAQDVDQSGVASTDIHPLITVITVVFNGAQTLEQTILSVINQSYDNIEYIIIDGGSTDGTQDILQQYDYAIDYWVSEPDNQYS